MHSQVLAFLRRMREAQPAVFAAGRVLECGAYIINGSPRELFAADEYVGLDWRAGPGVDVVALAHEYAPPAPFDVVVSTEMLEHDPFWRASLANMVRLLKVGGSLVLTCAAPERALHEQDCAPATASRPAGRYSRGLALAEVVAECRRLAVWEQVHGEQASAPADTYVLCRNLQAHRSDNGAAEFLTSGLVSVVVPAVGQPVLTGRALRSARAAPGRPVEVVLVDNGSRPDSAAALVELQPEVYLRYDRMLGYPAAVNVGILAAAGEYVCLLNNDAELCTPNWAARLIKTLEAWPADIVAPVTDFVANPPQQANAASGRAPRAVERLFFVCVLLRRSVFAAAGLLDEEFGLGNWEDEEFCQRLRFLAASGPAARVKGVFVVEPAVFAHHDGHQTFGRLPPGMFAGLLATNRQLLRRKLAAYE